MIGTVDFNTVTMLNQILKEHQIEYSVHTIAGCASCGLKLQQDGVEYNIDKILEIINDYLARQWLIAIYQPHDPTILYIDTKFHK